MEYQYPISHHWSTEEIVDVIRFFQSVEQVYEKGIERGALMESYRRFKEIVPGKADEKNICNEFEEVSGYSTYKAVQKMKQAAPEELIRL